MSWNDSGSLTLNNDIKNQIQYAEFFIKSLLHLKTKAQTLYPQNNAL